MSFFHGGKIIYFSRIFDNYFFIIGHYLKYEKIKIFYIISWLSIILFENFTDTTIKDLALILIHYSCHAHYFLFLNWIVER